MDKKEIQKKRMMSYFIEAANQIIENEGVDAITIRSVSDIAGYNSATLYNYFENLNHLIFFASMKYLKEYVLSLPDYLENYNNSLERYYRIWERFCQHSFRKPKIYYSLFFDRFSSSLNDDIKEYYSIFPEELGNQSEDIIPMLLGQNIYDRNMVILESCIPEGLVQRDELEEINEMNLLIYHGMLSRVLNKQIAFSIEEAVKRTLAYMRKTIESYLDKGEL